MITWDKKAAEEKGSKGTWANRAVRVDVYKNNCEIFKAEGYKTDSGKEVALPADDPMLAGTKVYREAFSVENKPAVTEKTVTGVRNNDSFVVAKELLGRGLNPAVLNLAGAGFACGYYKKGSRAQEESLCRASTLSRSLYQYDSEKNSEISNVKFVGKGYPMDMRYGGIYSPGVTVFRDYWDWYALLDEPYKVGVISVAALNFNEKDEKDLQYRSSDGGFTPEGEEIMKDKIRTIFRIALDNGHDSVVPGAFGCGAFHLRRDLVSQLFHDILEEPEFKNKFKEVCFAIFEKNGTSTATRGDYKDFYRLFGKQ